jgi:hypothetical protein
MDTTDELSFPRAERALFPRRPRGVTGANELIWALEVTGQEFHRYRDLYLLQQRCEALCLIFHAHEPGREALGWIATQAELIDCGLLRDRAESLEEALRSLVTRVRSLQSA